MHFRQWKRREFITLLGGAASLFFCVNAAAQEGYYGAGHDKWHQGFYSQLRRNDGGSCCNLMDCRPTQSRIVGDLWWRSRPRSETGGFEQGRYILCHSAFGGLTGV